MVLTFINTDKFGLERELWSLREGLSHFSEVIYCILGDVWHLAVQSEKPGLWNLVKVLCFYRGLLKTNLWGWGRKLSSARDFFHDVVDALGFFFGCCCITVCNTLISSLRTEKGNTENAQWVKADGGHSVCHELGQHSGNKAHVLSSRKYLNVCCLYIKKKCLLSVDLESSVLINAKHLCRYCYLFRCCNPL